MNDIEQILNNCLNEAMCQSSRIRYPNSNKIAEFVDKWMEKEGINKTVIKKPKPPEDRIVQDSSGWFFVWRV